MGVDYTFGAQAAEIRIEKKSGKIIVDHFASSFDMGRVINPLQLRGNVNGGVLMAIGATLSEELIYDENGIQQNPHFFKYKLPTIKDMPAKYHHRISGESRCSRPLSAPAVSASIP